MKLNYFTLLLLVSLSTSNCKSQNIDTAEMSKIVKQQATKMGEFLVQRNADSLIEFTHPKIINGIGGKQKTVEALEKGWLEQDEKNQKIIKDSAGEPSKIIYYNESYQCTYLNTMTVSYNDVRKVVIESAMIAISFDGKKWYFIDAVAGPDYIKNKFPELSEELVIPEPRKPYLLKVGCVSLPYCDIPSSEKHPFFISFFNLIYSIYNNDYAASK